MSIIVYTTSITSMRDIDKKQQQIRHVLSAKKIDFKEIDLAFEPDAKETMRTGCGQADALPPQIFNGEQYCGSYQQFSDANEDGKLAEFLQLK